MFTLLLAVTMLPYARTERADYFVTDSKLKVSIPHIEEFLDSTEKILTAKTPRFRYARVRDNAEVDFGCHGYLQAESSAGMVCADRVRAFSTDKRHDLHEVVHLVWGAAFTDRTPGPFWEEGFAKFIGDGDVDQRLARKLVRGKGSLSATHAGAARGDWYNASAAFQQWLVKRYGMPKLVAFFRLCAATPNESAAFEKTFVMTRQDAESLWLHGD